MAQTEDLIDAPLSFDKVGVIYDKVVRIPQSPWLSLDGLRGLNFNLKVSLTETRHSRYAEQSQRARDNLRLGNDRWRSIDLLVVNGVPDPAAKQAAVHSAAELLSHSFPFKLIGMPIRLQVTVLPTDTTTTLTYVPGPWVYVPANPRDLVVKSGPFASEEINLSKCYPEDNGQYSDHKFLLLLPSLNPGSSYRIQITNLEPMPLPEGIEATLRLVRPSIVK